MKTLERQFTALGWTFDLKFSNEAGTEFTRIHRLDDRGTGDIFIEECSPLEDELIKALKTHKGFLNFEEDAYSDLNAEDEVEWDDDWEIEETDALSEKDDEMGQ